MSKIQASIRYTIGAAAKFASSLISYPFSGLARHRMSAAYDSLNFSFYGRNHVDISDLITKQDLEVIIAPVKANPHNTTAFELLSIASIIKDKNCNEVFEIGTYDGRTTRTIALNLASDGGMVHTLNLPPGTDEVNLDTGAVDVQLASKVESGARFLNTPQAKNIKQLWGDSSTFDYLSFYGNYDLVFIDGAHSESYVASDTANALKLIKPSGGYVMWHDAPYFGVVKFLKKWIKDQDGPVLFIKGTSLAIAFVKVGRVAKWSVS